jgi:hypothetical protein
MGMLRPQEIHRLLTNVKIKQKRYLIVVTD